MNQDILIALLNDKSFYTTFTQKFSDLYTACVIIKQNINPDIVEKAIEKIQQYYTTHIECQDFINNYSANQSTPGTEYKRVAGMVFVIDTQESSYKTLIDTAYKEKWIFRGISIVPEFNHLRLYFY